MARRTTHRPLRIPAETGKGSRRVKATLGNGLEMARKRTSANSFAEAKKSQSCEGLVASQLSNIPGIDAVFIYADDDGAVHVYSVVPEFSFGLYKRLAKRERIIEKSLPQLRFDFHVRAHQGRKATRVVPIGARAVFVR